MGIMPQTYIFNNRMVVAVDLFYHSNVPEQKNNAEVSVFFKVSNFEYIKVTY